MDVVLAGGAERSLNTIEQMLVADGHTVRSGDPTETTNSEVLVVADEVTAAVFETLNPDGRYVTVELGGIAGARHPDIHATISGFSRQTGCYQCLKHRVDQENVDQVSQRPSGTAVLAGAVAGYELLKQGDQLFGSVIEIPYTRRQLLPAPECGCRDPLQTTVSPAYREQSLEQALTRAEQAVDQRIGLLRDVAEIRSVPVPYYMGTIRRTGLERSNAAPDQAAGVADDWNQAYMKAVGEGLERYAAGVIPESRIYKGSPARLNQAIPPAAFATAVDQAPDDNATTTIPWVRGTNLHTGESQLVPAAAVYFPPPKPRHFLPITTGLGLGSSTTEALLSGLTEVIERDAIMLDWYATGTPTGATVDDPQFERLVRRARSEDLLVTPMKIPHDLGVPVVAVAVHRSRWPKFAMGSAADLDPAAAACGALEEALQNWMELDAAGEEGVESLSGAIGRYSFEPVAAYQSVDIEETLTSNNAPTGAAALEELLETLSNADLSAYAVRITTQDLAELGFEAVRVLVPEAQPLFMNKPTFSERARVVPTELGRSPALDRDHHPYP